MPREVFGDTGACKSSFEAIYRVLEVLIRGNY